MRRSSNAVNASKRSASTEPGMTNTDSSSKDLERSSQDPGRTLPSVPLKRPHLLYGSDMSTKSAASNSHATSAYITSLQSVESQATTFHTGVHSQGQAGLNVNQC